MPFEKPLEQITEQDLLSLIADGEREGRALDYKREMYGQRDQDKIELCADVTSLANTVGGHLILGMDESEGLPTAAEGVSVPDIDKEMLRLQQVLRSGTQPKLPVVGMHPVPLSNGKMCLVIHVTRSWARPHAIINGEWLRYHARTSSGKYRLDVPEVKAAFLASETTAERMRAFRADRLAAIGAGEAPVELPDKPRLVYHCMSTDAFDLGTTYDLSALAKSQTTQQPMFDFAPFQKYNFDGLLMYEQVGKLDYPSSNGYVQAYGEGILEAVAAREFRTGTSGGIVGFQFENRIVDHVSRLRKALAALGVRLPVFVFVSVLGIRGTTVYASHNHFDDGSRMPIDRDALLFTEVTWEDEAIATEQLLKPVFDRLWRASGWEGSLSYDNHGTWNKERRQHMAINPWG